MQPTPSRTGFHEARVGRPPSACSQASQSYVASAAVPAELGYAAVAEGHVVAVAVALHVAVAAAVAAAPSPFCSSSPQV